MMKIDNKDQLIGRVLNPISAQEPCGKWLRYSSEFMSLSKLREEDDPNLPMGEWERPLIKADWKKIVDKCVNFLHQNSKDLQVAIWLCDGLVRTNQIYGLNVGLIIMSKLVHNYWENMWPEIEKNDDNARVAPFVWLNTRFISRLNQSIVLLQPSKSRKKTIYLDDWKKSLKDNFEKSGLSREKIRNSATEEDVEWLNEIKELSNESLVAVKHLSKDLDNYLGKESPSLFNLQETIQTISNCSSSLLVKFTINITKKEDAVIEKQSDSNSTKENQKEKTKEIIKDSKSLEHKNTMPVNDFTETLMDRDDAYNKLNEIAKYLQKIEPHSPTPYLIYKMVKWKNMNLEELINNIRDEEYLKGIFKQ